MICLVTTKELSELLSVNVSTVRRWLRDYGLPASPSSNKRTYYFDIFEVYDWLSQQDKRTKSKIKSGLMYRRRLHQYIFVTCFPEGGNLYFKYVKTKNETKPSYNVHKRVCTSYDLTKMLNCKTYNLRVWVNNGLPIIKGEGIANYKFDLDEVIEWIRKNRPDVYDDWTMRTRRDDDE